MTDPSNLRPSGNLPRLTLPRAHGTGRRRLCHGPSGCKRNHMADEALADDSTTEPDYSRPQPLHLLAAFLFESFFLQNGGQQKAKLDRDWMGRKELGVQNLLYEELLKTDFDQYRMLLRVSREQFLQLLSRLGPRIRREDTVMRCSISAETTV
ncbi:hypothetical protein HPB49_017681 [Dermacentor silvarum]|uniref:Uncharacterized protein n=1 Tax=Dermacentor silvarum TaxID=543639 RepID=A0ACB8CYG5_DERSI|nr:hypothetical protein HPB49_017681 [Dermacentor silvarum]